MESTELSRYSRQIILPEIGVEGQERIKAARVLIIGMGGLGCPAGLYLAAAGIGTLGLAEFDTVEAHNLQRQILHDNAAVGSPKLDSAMSRIRALNPFVELRPHPEGVTSENAVSLFSEYDVIVDGTDNFPTRYRNNDAAFFARRPRVHGTIFQFEGQVTTFEPARTGPCYRCLFPEMPEPGSVPNCEEAGVFGALCGVVGSWQAMEALKLITGVGNPLHGRLQVIDALQGQMRSIQLKRDPDCPLCGEQATILSVQEENYVWQCSTAADSPGVHAPQFSMQVPQISVHEAARAVRDGAQLLDVREDFEWSIARIPGSLHLPMGNVPDALGTLPREQRILVMCHHGGRSQRVATFLLESGFTDIANVEGGIDRWAVEIDPALQRY